MADSSCMHCGRSIRKGEADTNNPWIHVSGFYKCNPMSETSTKAEPDEVEDNYWNLFEHSDAVAASEEAYGRNPIEGTVSYPKRQHPRDYIRLIEED